MNYSVRFLNGTSTGVEADDFHVVHSNNNLEGSLAVQFTRRVPNPRYAPVQGTTFGVDAQPVDVADDDWEVRQRYIIINVCVHTHVTDVMIVE